MLGWLSNFLGIDSSSWNSIVHSSGSLSGSSRKSDNFLWMLVVSLVYKVDFSFFAVVDWLNKILGIDGVSWNSYISYSSVVLISNWLNNWVKSSSNFWGIYNTHNISIFLNLRLDVGIILIGVPWNVHGSFSSS